MRKVTEKTFKAYAKEAVKQLNTLELFAALRFTAVGVEISLYRNGVEVGHISISTDGLVRAKDLARNESFDIKPWHDNMKELFNAVYETVNGRLDDNGFKAEEECELTDEQIVNIAGRLYAGGWTMLDADMIAEKTGTNKKTAHRIMIQIGMYINHTLPEDIAQESEKTEKPEGRTITVTLHPEDEEEEKTITYTGVKTYGFVAGKVAKMIESHTDGSCIDKNHEYLVVVFRDLTETVFRRSSVVEVKEGNRILMGDGWDEDEPTAEEPQPTPEEADREVTYIDFKPEQDYEEERPPHAAFEQLRRDSIEPPKIWSCKALKVQEILQKIYEGKTKTSGERLNAYYNHCYNLILATIIFLPECMYRYLKRKLSNEMVITGVCPAVIEEAFGYKKTRRKWDWKL